MPKIKLVPKGWFTAIEVDGVQLPEVVSMKVEWPTDGLPQLHVTMNLVDQSPLEFEGDVNITYITYDELMKTNA